MLYMRSLGVLLREVVEGGAFLARHETWVVIRI